MNAIKLSDLQFKLGQRVLCIFAVIIAGNATYLTPIAAQPVQQSTASKVRFVPPKLPDRGAPTGRQRGGASRGNCPLVTQPLTALVPATPGKTASKAIDATQTNLEYVWGLTTAEYPTLWFYVPYALTSDLSIEVVLQNEQGDNVYKTSFVAPQTPPGVVKFTLPSTADPLEMGKMYRWYFLVYCNPDDPVFVEGWLKTVSPNLSFVNQIKQATPQERVALYAANGIWYDALTSLAELRTAYPQDSKLKADWVSLFNDVGLDAIASAPIVDCCTP